MQTVLIVDDWPALRQRLDEALSGAGYLTITAHNGQEALGLLRSVRADLLVVSQELSDVEGLALARILRHRGYDELVIVLLARPGQEGLIADEALDAVLPRTMEVGPVVEAARRLLRPVIRHNPPSAELGHSSATYVA